MNELDQHGIDLHIGDSEAAQFDPQTLFAEEIDRRRELNDVVNRTAAVIFDLQEKGALYQYVMHRRVQAQAALSALVDADPRDAVEIAQNQAVVKEFIASCNFVHSSIAQAATAEQTIKEEYGDGKTED